ncbi:hypothetical protein EDB19DRAFT_235389 [Suillus lakei]|nr:hypothetical protein EDB19DRAFT_235389 [Suillus lakei]
MYLMPFIDDDQIPDLATEYPNSNPNYSEFNYQSISAIIAERQQHLDTVSHEVSRLETVMDSIKHIHQQLIAKKDKIIAQSMNLHKRLVTALWRLPTEVLSQIFVYCLPNYHYLSASHLAPMLLTRICRRWREVAVGTPSLWCRLHVSEDAQRAALCYDTWLKRSRGCPLSLKLHCNGTNWTGLRSLLQPYINQILCLDLHFSTNIPQPELMISDFLALEELNVSFDWSHPKPALAQFISQPPCTLRSLEVSEVFFDVEYASAFNPTWAHLTYVDIDIGEPNAFLQLLRLCPDLSSLTICTSFVAMEALEPCTHTKLQSLHIHSADTYDDDSIEYFNLFDTLSLPNLRTLEAHYVQPWPHDEFKTFLTRSECPLESLTLQFEIPITDEQRAEYVALIPSLEVLVE